ncbi:hypothetical protein DPMN_148797 [Dreissena polymorpha]|uniref:VWFD domain-containing protein n=1 Tax=Dreissena polymorpha TaxID=45954 RepID=A0A9D4FAA3_DREPO|nr:hypothetical protein DPMN_148797 [Dreissena polymorpha]
MLGQLLRNNTIHNTHDPVDSDHAFFMNEISSCKDTPPHWTNEITPLRKLFSHDFFDTYTLPPIKVHSIVSVDQLAGKYCYAHSDPHTKPFDQRSTFESRDNGTFVMYRNARFKTDVQIQQGIRWNYSPLRDYPYCVVAIAVRAGGDVYVIDLVNTKTAFVQCKDGVLSRKVRRKSKNEYMIYLPTGTEVQVKNTRHSFLEVDIYPGLQDFGETDGLCGKFDGTSQANDNCGTCTE